jgi:hypothetical protein
VEALLVADVGHCRIVHLARGGELLEARSSTMQGVFALPDAISLGRFLLEVTRPEPGEHRSELARLRRWLEVNVDHPRAFLIREMLGTCKMYIGWAAAWATPALPLLLHRIEVLGEGPLHRMFSSDGVVVEDGTIASYVERQLLLGITSRE